jgi:hypothetical protein
MPIVEPPSRTEEGNRFQLVGFRFFQRALDISRFTGSR